MKKIIFSLSGIAVVAALVIASTGAFFSDTETSTGNTFTAGAIDLKVDSTQHYNNAKCVNNVWVLETEGTATVPQFPVIGTVCGGTWGQGETQEGQGVDITDQKFFEFGDVKPGDSGENTISLHVINNDAWVCATVSKLTNADNSTTEPESTAAGNTSGGDLQNAMVWKVWRDNASTNGAVPGDNIWQEGEAVLAEGHPVNGTLAVYDSTTGIGALPGGSTAYLGVSWSLPSTVGNEVQTDSLTGDISFDVVQSRNNSNFACGQQRLPVESLHISLENKAAGSWAIIANDNTFGDIQYSSNDTSFHGLVTGTGLVAGGKYQITLNGPGSCTFTDAGFAGKGPNAFSSGYWNNGSGLDATCSTPGEGVYNMNLVGDHYTFIADGSGAFSYPFSFSLPAGSYTGVKVLVKKMLDTHVSPWADTGTGYPAFNLYETAPISFTVN